MTGDSYDKAVAYLNAVATPDLYPQLEPKDYIQLAIAHALMEIAAALDESGEALDIISGKLNDIDVTLVAGLLNK